jgi:hypothetical protein
MAGGWAADARVGWRPSLIFTTIVPLDPVQLRSHTGYGVEQVRKETAMAQGDHRLQDVILHLPSSLRDRVEEMASRECVSLNLFVLMAVAEKLQRLQLRDCLDLGEKDALARDANPDPVFLDRLDRVH